MEENVTPSDDEKSKRVSPKVARPKLPKFGSQTLGHHFRHKTDPGQASEIKNLMEEIKKWKEGSIFDKTPIRTKMIKPQQMIPKAHSTQTSPRSSPPPGSPGSGKRSSSLNRNRSKSLKLLTDKLKSPKGGSTKDAPSSPGVVMSQSTPPGTDMFSKSNNTVGLDAPIFVVDTGDGETEQEMRPMQESDKERTSIVEPIPEHDERIEEDDKERDNETKPDYDRSFDKNVSFLKTDVVKPKVKYVGQNIDEETAAMSDGDSPVTHVSSFTLHPIDRNSQFLRLRQTAPPKRRPGYAGLSLPRPKISMFKKQPDDSSQEPARSMDDSVIKKPTKLDLPGFSSMRKLSTPKCLPLLKSKEEFGALDISGHNLFRTPSTDSPPSFIGEENAIESPSDSKSLDGDRSEPQGAFSDNFNVESEQEIVVDDKPEKRISRSPKQKSKSDPSGNKTFDFETAGVINSSQSKSFPLLDKEYPPGSIEEISEVEDSGTETVTDNLERPDPTELDILNNNENPTLEEQRQSSGASVSFSDTDRFENDSVSDDTSLFSSQSNISEPFDDPSCKTLILEGFPRPFSEGMAPLQEDGDEDALTNSCGSESSTSTPVSYSPTGTLERQHNLLNVPSPKRPILRSVSSASVLQRERKLSGNNKDKENHRKHSLTTGDDTVPIEGPPMDFLPIGDAGNVLASSMPAVWNMDRLPSMSPERETQYVKDKRYHITEELFRNEREYVDALKMLKERYMDPLKTVSGIDERVVDNIFYMIPEILTHHQIYLEFLNQIWTRWNTDTSTVGDLIQKTFSGQTVQDSYLSFVENYKTSGKVIENALQTKSSVQKFVEQCQKESGSKLSLKDLIVRPIQRIPRYELLIQRLLVNTPPDHPDYALLQDAEKVMHEFARKIGSLSETNTEDGQQETLKKLELLLITDLAVPDRAYLRHDMVNIMNKKDQCCIWMFSDVLIISSVKRKSGPVTRKVSIILKSPTGQDFAENVKHKVWLKVGLDDIEIVKSARTLKREASLDREQVEEDLDLLSMIQDVASKLNCQHAALDDCMKELTQNLNKQLVEHDMRSSLLDASKMELLVTTQEGVTNLEVNFVSVEKRTSWESTFLDAKQKLSQLSDRRAAEFLQPLQITKTRAGMQFSCAAPIDGVNSSGHRDVWVCNSDGYVGHMCLLSLQPEPIVTLNTPVPGCNARILCISAVPALASLRRKSSCKRYSKHGPPSPMGECGPRISVEEVDSAITEEDPRPDEFFPSDFPVDEVSEEGYQSDSSSSDDETDDDYIATRKLYVEDFDAKRPSTSSGSTGGPDSITTTGAWHQDRNKSTMWLGTEDGCIHIFQCTDNIKTTKNKLKIQLGYPVYCILYLDNKVFVSLSNGDLIVYRRDSDGLWDTENPYTRAIGSVTGPIVRMLAVAGKLWCGRQNSICVINPLTLSIETFQMHQDSNRSVQCIVNSGQGVWIAAQQSSKVLLYHATSFEFLLEVNIALAVNQKLQSADDIIRQHKAACLRITALLVCKDLLWIGTSAGVILTVPVPKITSTTSKGSLTAPTVTGRVHGHTGHVRFLTCVEMSPINMPPILGSGKTRADTANNNRDPPSPHDISKRRSSVATMTAALATRMLVISGGDGYEDFRTNVVNESAGKDDSTNHLLLWQV
ncbi:rho guanine nucleotide exchange factor 17-like isoform X2 [Mya arenaria]|uniref:rho guanine nucleotide exchange factor 17-like isoform X2 n=1 Tax=Mya arenaria TaxID=6604 RepID=UPI0022E9104E|nr:rho guanine nucleotide exchange factor 17-like isoform X2 [Mya arenaria]